MAPRIGHRELLSLHQNRLEHHQANLNELTTNALRNPLREHLDISGFDIKNARRIHTSRCLQVGTSVTVGNSITINQNIALGGNITDLDGNVLTFGGGGGGISSTDLIVNAANQTFTKLLTEQPNKFNQNGSPTTSSSQITINWNYTDIIPTDENIRKFAQGSTIKSRCLPYINEIKLQLYGTVTGTHESQSNTWIDYQSLSILPNEDYNAPALGYRSLKTITFTKRSQSIADNSAIDNILSKTDSFLVRIFGINDNGNDFPNILTRALVITGVAFDAAFPPTTPQFQINKEKFYNGNIYHLTSNFIVNETEANVTNSAAILDGYITTFYEHSSLRSGYFSLSSQSGTTSENLSNIPSNTNFTIKIGNNNLRAGTRYNYTVTVSNNISTANSPSSAQQLSLYTRLPTSSNGATLTLTETTQETSVTSSTFINQNVIYLNSNILGKTHFNVSNTSNQTFEITKPYTSNQETTIKGFGRFIDNEFGLVSISLKINNISKETITFNGFDKSLGIVGYPIQYSTTYFGNATIQDMYSDDNNKGFRLLGTVSLKNINSDKIGVASSNAYTLQYVYQRNYRVVDGSSDETETTSHVVYVDDLSDLPTLSINGTDSITINYVKYCMGIPSVEKFTVNLGRTYRKINSSHKFIPGDKIIGGIQSIKDTNWSSTDFTLQQTDLNASGTYNKVYESSSYYTARKVTSDNLNINENAVSLRGTTTNASNIITVNHYFDMDSFTRDSSTGNLEPSLDLTNVYEITDSTELAKLGSNLGGIGVTNYSNHGDVVKDHTLLYINGNFRTNASFNYPNVNNYTWDDVSVPNKYNSGSLAFSTTGTSGNSNGYKWIVFKVNQSNYVSESISGTTYKYYNVKGYLQNTIGISGATVSKIKDKDNNDAIGFITQSVSSVVRIGNLSRDFNTTDAWYDQPSDISYNTMTSGVNKAKYGTNHNALNGNWGPLLDTDNGSNDIYIYIGFKNSVDLY
tara:strand:+ start:349 stop:3270 length:2922 start_codon:yes stop_codon:yes gene_type:complete